MINHWAARHGVSAEALNDLRALLGASTETRIVPTTLSNEVAVQAAVRLEASQCGARLWRNNVGATYTADGRFIRFGLCNESKNMNDSVKSSDLVGIRRIEITPEYVGCAIGQFVAREIKAPGWKYRNTKRERAQLQFLTLVAMMGGDARFASAVGTL
jgi:hypothetical protein